jgi:hypothetical protein
MKDDEKKASWTERLELPEDGRLDISVLDASYALERVSGGVLKITRKKGDKETASFACLDVKRAVYQPQPDFHDLPTMIKLKEDLLLAPGAGAELFLEVPVKAQLVALLGKGRKERIVLDELKQAKQLQSFYGPPNEGIFCNAIYAKVYSALEEAQSNDYRAILPLSVENRHSKQISITRLLIPSDRLALFAREQTLITNRVRLKVKTDEDGELDFLQDTVSGGFSRITTSKTAVKSGAIGKLTTLGAMSPGEMQFGF